MIVLTDETVTLDTANGPMRTHIARPVAPGRYPGIVFFSEIFQITAPIRRMAAFFAGNGYIVAAPEIYHEFEPAGTVLAYDQAGADRGNALKTTKTIASYDADARAVLDHLGVTTGAKISVSLLEDGRVELVAAAARDDINSLRGALHRPGQRPVSLEEMQEAIEAGNGR